MECRDKRYQIILQMAITLCSCMAKTAAAKCVREVLLVRRNEPVPGIPSPSGRPQAVPRWHTSQRIMGLPLLPATVPSHSYLAAHMQLDQMDGPRTAPYRSWRWWRQIYTHMGGPDSGSCDTIPQTTHLLNYTKNNIYISYQTCASKNNTSNCNFAHFLFDREFSLSAPLPVQRQLP